jgi:hypothetical protein
MHRQTIASFAAVAALSSLLAGCAPEWVVHAQAAPDPFLNQRSFAVLPVDFTGYLVGGKTEAEYLSAKEPDTQSSFQADKASINEFFTEVLTAKASHAGLQIVKATGPQSAPFQIRPSLVWLEPGYYVGVSARPAELKMIVRLTDANGTVLDEIEEHETAGGMATGERLRRAAEKLGDTAAAYLMSRVGMKS